MGNGGARTVAGAGSATGVTTLRVMMAFYGININFNLRMKISFSYFGNFSTFVVNDLQKLFVKSRNGSDL